MPESLNWDEKYKLIRKAVLGATCLSQVKAVSRADISAEPFIGRSLMAIRSPSAGKLIDCTPVSIVNAIVEASLYGITPEGYAGEGFLVPLWNKDIEHHEAEFWLGYPGLARLVRQSGNVLLCPPEVVVDGDQCTYSLGTSPSVHIVKREDGVADAKLVRVFAMAFETVGSITRTHVETMDRSELLAIGEKAAKKGGWTPWKIPDSREWRGMCKKTVFASLCRYLPQDARTRGLLQRDSLSTEGHRDQRPDDSALNAAKNELRHFIVKLKDRSGDMAPRNRVLRVIQEAGFNNLEDLGGISPQALDEWTSLQAIEGLRRKVEGAAKSDQGNSDDEPF